MYSQVFWISFGYLLGSIPLGLCFSKIFGLGDLRAIGSGNIGATNVLRTGNKIAALLTLLGDLLKGSLPIWAYLTHHHLYRDLGPTAFFHPILNATVLCIAMATVLGHIFPFWLNFKGGKGVATTLGVYAVISPISLAFAIAIWLIVFSITKISSFSALLSLCLAVPLFAGILAYYNPSQHPLFLFSVAVAGVILTTHAKNIQRLLAGTEQRMQFKKKQGPQ